MNENVDDRNSSRIDLHLLMIEVEHQHHQDPRFLNLETSLVTTTLHLCLPNQLSIVMLVKHTVRID